MSIQRATPKAQRRPTVRFEDTKDLLTSQEADLGHTMRVAKGDTDLRGRKALPGELDDVLDDILG
jgi:hypothetical protein